MTALIKANPQLPAAIQRLMASQSVDALKELSGGVTSGFPIISYKGKVWRVRKGGEEKIHVDDNGDALPSIEVVLVQANPMPSKIFYDKAYEEGVNESPRCFSNDGVKPDVQVQQPISPICANCPNNVWGSRISESGKKGRACSDARRMAVVFAHDLYENGENCQKFLLRVPPASLNPLKDYAEKTLAPKGIPFYGIVTRIGFDVQSAHPQFVFRAARFINDEEAEVIAQLRDSEDVKRILAEAQEFPAGAAGDGTATSPAASAAPQPVAAPAPVANPASAGTAARPAMRPATEEEAGLAAAPPARNAAPAPAPAQAAAPAPVTGEVMAAPAPRRKAAAKPAQAAPAAAAPAAAAPVVREVEEQAPTGNGAQPAGFDDLLNSILNG